MTTEDTTYDSFDGNPDFNHAWCQFCGARIPSSEAAHLAWRRTQGWATSLHSLGEESSPMMYESPNVWAHEQCAVLASIPRTLRMADRHLRYAEQYGEDHNADPHRAVEHLKVVSSLDKAEKVIVEAIDRLTLVRGDLAELLPH